MGTTRNGGCGAPPPPSSLFGALAFAMSFLLLGRSSSALLLLPPRPLSFAVNVNSCGRRCHHRGGTRRWSGVSTTTGFNETVVQEATSSTLSSIPSNPQQQRDDDPWSHPRVEESTLSRRRRKSNKARFRQHVNPLARQYQQPCAVSDGWPQSAYHNVAFPLHVDIGCGKGGFVMDLAGGGGGGGGLRSSQSDEGVETSLPDAAGSSSLWGRRRNLLGLEIRPLVAQHARDKLAQLRLAATGEQSARSQTYDNVSDDDWTGRVDFIGCNVNVDLDRILTRYTEGNARAKSGVEGADGTNAAPLEVVTIQFPDPHFKSYHAKRRVVNSDLVLVLAKHLQMGSGRVFLQSDVQHVLDDMRQQFASHPTYFADLCPHPHEYYPHNVFGVPTEREVSVLEKGLPVYRALFARKSVPFDDNAIVIEGA